MASNCKYRVRGDSDGSVSSELDPGNSDSPGHRLTSICVQQLLSFCFGEREDLTEFWFCLS